MTTIYLVESHINDCSTSLHAFLTKNCAENYVANYTKDSNEKLIVKEIPIS